jgi:hypothetical protein
MTRGTVASVAAVAAFVTMAAAQPRAADQKAADQKAVAKAAPAVTLTGCLHEDGDGYKLTRVAGRQAPTGRSWKTAFIKKTTKDVEVVGLTKAVKLGDHIGRRVTVVGVREGNTPVKAKSIKRVAASCS